MRGSTVRPDTIGMELGVGLTTLDYVDSIRVATTLSVYASCCYKFAHPHAVSPLWHSPLIYQCPWTTK